MAELLAPVCEKVFLSSRSDQNMADVPPLIGCKRINDEHVGLGPVGGLATLMSRFPKNAWMIAACDLPFLTIKDLEKLLRERDPFKYGTCYIKKGRFGFEPMFAIYEPKFIFPLFQVMSILTTTGFTTADYVHWGPFAQILLLLLMFVGGSAGSTAGGMKIARIMVVIKYSLSEIKRLLHPRAVIPVRIGKHMITEEVIRNTLGFFLFYVAVFVVVSVMLAALGLDIESAFGATAASIGNVGPGHGSVGPASNYAHLPDLAKWLLTFCMLLGRLEIFTVMVFLSTIFSRR